MDAIGMRLGCDLELRSIIDFSIATPGPKEGRAYMLIAVIL